MITHISSLLDFSNWKFEEVKNVTPLNEEELTEMESLLTNYSGELSQFDLVRMVITYKLKIEELSK